MAQVRNDPGSTNQCEPGYNVGTPIASLRISWTRLLVKPDEGL
jgi:hypothetical protein